MYSALVVLDEWSSYRGGRLNKFHYKKYLSSILIHFSFGERAKIALLNVILSLWGLKQEGTTVFFNFSTFFGENGRLQLIASYLIRSGNNNRNLFS